MQPAGTAGARLGRRPRLPGGGGELPGSRAFLLACQQDRRCDIPLLDIEMPGEDGIETARQLRALGDELAIVFVTGYDACMNQGCDVQALHYLLKPVDEDKLFAALDRPPCCPPPLWTRWPSLKSTPTSGRWWGQDCRLPLPPAVQLPLLRGHCRL